MNLVEAVNKALGTNGTNLQGALNEAAGVDASNVTEAISKYEGGGGGGLDSFPAFTITESGDDISITCNKTYDEVVALATESTDGNLPCCIYKPGFEFGVWSNLKYYESSHFFYFTFYSSKNEEKYCSFKSDGSITVE